MSSLCSLSLMELRDRLANGSVQAVDAVSACFDRIRTTEPLIKATIPPLLEEQAMAQAKALDAAGPDVSKPLWGVPLMIKDCISIKGAHNTCASRMLENFVPFYDATVVEKLRDAGAVFLAKTNMDEFAMGSSTEHSAFHATTNPWNTDRIPGGSSGGSAAAVAASQCFGALGSDTGGSIRQPAGLCGCVGIKPTYGRVSRYGVTAYASSMDQVGTLARTVEDAALLLQVIAGHDPREATCADIPVPDYCAALKNAKDLKGLRIGLPQEFWTGNETEVTDACRASLEKAQSLGATLVDVSLPHTRYGVAAYYILSPAEASTNLARYDGVRYGMRDKEAKELVDMYVASRSHGLGEEVQRRILLGTFVLSAGYYDAYYKKAAQVRRLILEDYRKALGACDVLCAPASPMTAWPMGELAGDPLTAYQRDALTLSLNLAGYPGITIPVGLGEQSRLPVGMQILGRAFDEEGILKAAHVLHKALPALAQPTAMPPM